LKIIHGVTLGGFGQFGRIPSDLARWHARFPKLHEGTARLFGIERLTNIEYGLTLLLRSVSCMLLPSSMEEVEIRFQNTTERMRLLSGVVMNFPIKALPFKATVKVEDEAVVVYLIPFNGRLSPLLQVLAPQHLIHKAHCIRLEKNQFMDMEIKDRGCVEFFLDEDPQMTCGSLRFGIAGSIAFVPGPNYQRVAAQGVSE
jgi:hypothetical protein